ncbi:MAG: c-type cytochrome domain-containing protein [Gemmataceae bacterium]
MFSRFLAIAVTLSILCLTRPATAEVDFVKDIKPVLEQKCLQCHGAEKPKVGLRMDTREGVIKGGKGGAIVVVGKAEESLLLDVISLPQNDSGRMPPEGKPLTKEQVAQFRAWINEGLKWPDGLVLKPVGGSTETTQTSHDAGVPITAAEKAAVTKVQQAGVLALRLAQNTNLLRIDFALRGKEVKDEELALLKDMPNLIELNLAGTDITDASLAHLKDLPRLTRLQLQKTSITDKGLEHLKGLRSLTSLNLFGTEVTDEGIEQLKDLKNLKRLYLWQSKVTENAAQKLTEAIPGLVVNVGKDIGPAGAQVKKPDSSDK